MSRCGHVRSLRRYPREEVMDCATKPSNAMCCDRTSAFKTFEEENQNGPDDCSRTKYTRGFGGGWLDRTSHGYGRPSRASRRDGPRVQRRRVIIVSHWSMLHKRPVPRSGEAAAHDPKRAGGCGC